MNTPLIDRLKVRYPHLDFQRDPVTGAIGFCHDDVFIVDPWCSPDPRFPAQPQDYGLDLPSAVAIFDHNLLCGETITHGPYSVQ